MAASPCDCALLIREAPGCFLHCTYLPQKPVSFSLFNPHPALPAALGKGANNSQAVKEFAVIHSVLENPDGLTLKTRKGPAAAL